MTAQVFPLFKQAPFDRKAFEVPAGVSVKSFSIDVKDDDQNFALRVAEQEDFLSLCRHSLWGNESVTEFGEHLRGLVIAYQPKNRWHLDLLAQIADASWKVQRLRKLQRATFDAHPFQAGKNGVPLPTIKAMEMETHLQSAVQNLNSAIATYRKGAKVTTTW